jgi:non-canonical (house-cleaning) NTP pyrophosphatase
MAARALAGEELGRMVDDLAGRGAHEALGAVGLLTRGVVDRQAALEQAVAAALIPFLEPSSGA